MTDNVNASINVEAGSLSDDLLWGIDEIADFIGQPRRQTFHLIETGQLPVGRAGKRLVGSRAKIRARFEAIFSGEAA